MELSGKPTITQRDFPSRCKAAARVASDLFGQDPTWDEFFREMYGLEGVVRRLFPEDEEREEFERTDEGVQIKKYIAQLRKRATSRQSIVEPTRMITVRLPKSLHESLRVEAESRNTSMNQLCISKLLQVIEDQQEEDVSDD